MNLINSETAEFLSLVVFNSADVKLYFILNVAGDPSIVISVT